jgi:hypothetical protein
MMRHGRGSSNELIQTSLKRARNKSHVCTITYATERVIVPTDHTR